MFRLLIVNDDERMLSLIKNIVASAALYAIKSKRSSFLRFVSSLLFADGLERQPHLETGVTRLCLESYVTVVFSDNPHRSIEPQTRSFADWLGCEKRLEYT